MTDFSGSARSVSVLDIEDPYLCLKQALRLKGFIMDGSGFQSLQGVTSDLRVLLKLRRVQKLQGHSMLLKKSCDCMRRALPHGLGAYLVEGRGTWEVVSRLTSIVTPTSIPFRVLLSQLFTYLLSTPTLQ